jgi:hypothetical protein
MFLICTSTVTRRATLEFRQLPRRFLGRAFVWPRGDASGGHGLWRLKLRLIFEIEVLRYIVALAPFAIAALIWRDKALAISQAPLLMVFVVYAVEMRVLRPSAAAREAMMAPADRDRALDLLAARGRQVLTRIGAGRRMSQGTLHLVVEQSDLARVPALTLVSVQWSEGPAIIDLTPEERALIHQTLFAPPLTEATMHRLTLARNERVHTVTQDLRTIPAHARMAALTGV